MAQSNSAVSVNDEVIVPTGLKFSKVIVWAAYFWVLIGVIALSLRVFLLAASANTEAGFANFVMRVSGDYLEPFNGIFSGRGIGETGYLDVSAIFAIIVYLFVVWGFKSLIEYVQGKIDADKNAQALKIAEAKRKAEKLAVSQKASSSTSKSAAARQAK